MALCLLFVFFGLERKQIFEFVCSSLVSGTERVVPALEKLLVSKFH